MKLTISLFALMIILGTSARQQAIPAKYSIKKPIHKPLVKQKSLIKPSDELLIALKTLEEKSQRCNRAVNKILKNQKDSLSLMANKNE